MAAFIDLNSFTLIITTLNYKAFGPWVEGKYKQCLYINRIHLFF